MDRELLTRWTAIITNIAVVVGLVFVGLEFRNNTRSLEAERIDSFVGGAAGIDTLIIENEGFAEILVQSYKNSDALTESDVARIQQWLIMHYDNFRRTMLAHRSGLLTDPVYENQRMGIGFVFLSDTASELVDSFRQSELDDKAWEEIARSAKEARSYCLDPKNTCLERYEK